MDPYTVQPWLPWALVTALLMMGAWMRMGSSLFVLGVAALVALVEAALKYPRRVQIASFVAVSCVLAFLQWAYGRRRRAVAARCCRGEHDPPGE
jgi:membrane protein implicated in regulation of membrane protease activity